MTSNLEYGNYCAGGWIDVPGNDPMRIENPATEDVIGSVPSRGVVDEAVSAAAAALPSWLETTPRERAEVLFELADCLEANATALATVEAMNVGKPLAMAEDEMRFSADILRFIGVAARCMTTAASGEYEHGLSSFLRREPIGIVAALPAWNYPLLVAMSKLGPALAGGNVCVIKPADQTSLSILRFMELAGDCIPPGVVNVVTGPGSTTGAELVADDRVGMVTLTGGVQTGKVVAAASASKLKRVALELGGKAAVVVFGDADIDAAVAAIRMAGFWNSGQECASANRVLVASDIYDALLDKLVPAVESITVGPVDGSNVDFEMGPVITGAHQRRVLEFVERAHSGGASVLTGGSATGTRGYFVQPTVVAGVAQSDEIVQREVFGPVVTMQRFDGEEQAVAWANDVEFGLSGSVWTQDLGRAMRVSRRLKCGIVWVNDHLPLVAEMPWGGFKQSGYGNEWSIHSLEDYTQLKHVMVRIAPTLTA